MGRITRVMLTLVVCGLCSVGAAQAAGPGKVLICHGTASDTNPYVLIGVSVNAAATHLDGHGKNNYPDSTGSADCSGSTVGGE